jgi:hypothetical protein
MIEEYKKSIELLKKHGFEPIGVTESSLEDVFIFATPEEAHIAYYRFESNNENHPDTPFLDGWWYGFEQFVEDFHRNDFTVPIIWLDKDFENKFKKLV